MKTILNNHADFLWKFIFPFAFMITIVLIFFPSSSIYLIQTTISPRVEEIEMEKERVLTTYEDDEIAYIKIAAFLVNINNPQISRITKIQIRIRQLNQSLFKMYQTTADGDFSLIVPLMKIANLHANDIDYEYEIRGEGLLLSTGIIQLLVKVKMESKNPIALRIIEVLGVFSALLYLSEWLRREGVW